MRTEEDENAFHFTIHHSISYGHHQPMIQIIPVPDYWNLAVFTGRQWNVNSNINH